MPDHTIEPFVSVIIPTCESQGKIVRCLRSLKKQTYRRFESIVVDCNSTDKTASMSRRLGARVLSLKSGRSRARNYAAQRSNADFLFFIDSDMELSPRIIEECVRESLQNNVSAVIVPERYIGNGPFGECRGTEKQLLSSLNEVAIPRFFRRNVFLDLGGYDEGLDCGEDFCLLEKLKAKHCKLSKIDSEIDHVEGSVTLFSATRKAYTYGKSIPKFIEKTPQQVLKRYSRIRVESTRSITAQGKRLRFLLSFAALKAFESFGYTCGALTTIARAASSKAHFSTLASGISKRKYAIASFVVLTLVALAVFRNFLLVGGISTGNDFYGWVSREYIYARGNRWLYVWRPYSFGFVEGVNLLDLFFLITHVIFQDAVSTMEGFLVLSFLLAGIAMYAFAHSYTHNNLASFSAALVYTFNQWFFSQITEGHVDIIFSYAFAPLLFLAVDHALKTGKIKSILLSAFAFTIFLTGFHANAVVIYGVFLVLFLIVFLFHPSRDLKIKERTQHLLKFLVIGGIIVSLLAAFFTIPFFMNVRAYFLSEDYKYPIEEAMFFSASNLTDAFTLGATEEGGYISVLNVRGGFGLLDFPVQSFLLVVFGCAYLAIFFRRDRYTMFFLISAIVSIFISKGANPPIGGFFMWAWLNIPHFAVFRRPNRWEMMTAFSTAFFVAVMVKLASDFVRKKGASAGGNPNGSNPYRRRVNSQNNDSQGSLDQLLKVLRKTSKYLAVFLIISVLLSGLLSCWFFFANGFLTYNNPKDYMKPFDWIAGAPGDFKVVTINKSPSEWADASDADTDFAFSRMMTDVGWIHDIGFDSDVIHDKPTLQDGGWEPASRLFVDYLRRSLVYDNITRDFLKVLGSFSYKYVVIPPYSSERVKDFLLEQEGGRVVYNESDSLIIENDFFTPDVFSPENYAIVVGGLETFPSLCSIDSFNLNKTALVFIDPRNVPSLTDDKLASSQAIVFANGANLQDTVMPLMGDTGALVLARNYAVPSDNVSKYWILSTFWSDVGKLVLGGETLTTRGECKTAIPITVPADGSYDIWIRIGFGPDRGELSVSLDEDQLGKLSPRTSYWETLRWVKVAVSNVEKGTHTIYLRNDGTGYNDVDAICVVKQSDLQAKLETYRSILQSFKGRLIYVLQPEDFLTASTPDWSIFPEIFEGKMLAGNNALVNAAPSGEASASSMQFLIDQKTDASQATDGNVSSRWASLPYENSSQWLEIDWAEPYELVGTQVLFETAYGKDYLIQTWDSEKSEWIDQVNVTDNTELLQFYAFQGPVNTTKLRIYLTGFSVFNMVSIYEFEAYEKSTTISSSPSIFRNGTYQLFVRAESQENNSRLYLQIGDRINELIFPNATGLQWTNAGTFQLNQGEQELQLGVLGKVNINRIILSSLLENESQMDLPQLFGGSDPTSPVTYQRTDPCTYSVQVTSEKPFLLVLSESYNPLWKLRVNGEEISPTIAYSFLNAFFVNSTGNLTMTLHFVGQDYVDIGLKIASITFVATVVVLITPSTVFRKLANGRHRKERRTH